jgi:hypothetical protein
MQLVDAWKASDGKLFLDPEECKEYEFELTWIPLVVEFLESPFNKYNQGTSGVIARNSIIAWERFQEARQLLAQAEAVYQDPPEEEAVCQIQESFGSTIKLFPEGPLNPQAS